MSYIVLPVLLLDYLFFRLVSRSMFIPGFNLSPKLKTKSNNLA